MDKRLPEKCTEDRKQKEYWNVTSKSGFCGNQTAINRNGI